MLHDKFVAGGIIAKLPLAWWDFATTLKRKRREFKVVDLIRFLDVEENGSGKNSQERS
jgi:hypothetical protein